MKQKVLLISKERGNESREKIIFITFSRKGNYSTAQNLSAVTRIYFCLFSHKQLKFWNSSSIFVFEYFEIVQFFMPFLLYFMVWKDFQKFITLTYGNSRLLQKMQGGHTSYSIFSIEYPLRTVCVSWMLAINFIVCIIVNVKYCKKVNR